MKIITWKVNSVHARLSRVTALLARHQPDLACLQEIKTSSGEFPAGDFAAVGYAAAVHGQAGRNGVAVLTRIPLADATSGFSGDPWAGPGSVRHRQRGEGGQRLRGERSGGWCPRVRAEAALAGRLHRLAA